MFGGGKPAAKHNNTPSFEWYCPPRWNAPKENKSHPI
jgi:hypothetical protein